MPLTITNDAGAQVAAVGTVQVELFLSATPTLDNSAVPMTLAVKQQTATVNLAPGKSAKLSLKAAVPANLPAGSYYLIARINGDVTVAEMTLADDVTASNDPSAA